MIKILTVSHSTVRRKTRRKFSGCTYSDFVLSKVLLKSCKVIRYLLAFVYWKYCLRCHNPSIRLRLIDTCVGCGRSHLKKKSILFVIQCINLSTHLRLLLLSLISIGTHTSFSVLNTQEEGKSQLVWATYTGVLEEKKQQQCFFIPIDVCSDIVS